MKKQLPRASRLQLSRETVRTLATVDLRHAAGGVATISCVPCPTRPCTTPPPPKG